jgi:hypothetical protein
LKDEAIINDILTVKVEKAFDFEKEWAKSISIKEARQKSSQFITSLPWKK